MQKAPEAFRTISEAADELDVPQHVLRFWETRFSQIRPMKRAGGRRYYRPQDIDLLRGIRRLLYDEGYTIKGVQKILRQHGVAHVVAIGRGELAIAPGAGVPAVSSAPAATATDTGKAPAASGASGAASTSSGNVTSLAQARGNQMESSLRRELEAILKELEQVRALLMQALDEAGASLSSDAGPDTDAETAEADVDTDAGKPARGSALGGAKG